MDSISIHPNASEFPAILDSALKVEHSVIHPHREQLGVPVSMDLIVIRRHLPVECLCDLLEIIVSSDSMYHLISCHKCEIVGNHTESRMGHQIYIITVAIVSTLSKPSVKLPHLLLVDSGSIEDWSCHKLKLLRPAGAVICPQPQPSLVIALKYENILPVHDRYQEIYNLRILHASVDIITCKYIELIILYTAIVIQILHQRCIAS